VARNLGARVRSVLRGETALALGVIVAVSAVLSYRANSLWDYPEDAGPAINALIHLDLHGFLAARPEMGPFSLLFRAPFAALSRLTEAPGYHFYNDAYRFGIFPCMVCAGLLGLWLARIARERGQPLIVQAVILGLCMVSNPTLKALVAGHPEEILAGVLVVGAAVAGLRGRPWTACLLLALGLATKQWAVVAIVPVALTLPARRLRRVALVGAAVVAAVMIPFLVVDPGSLFHSFRLMADIRGSGILVANVWYPFTGARSSSVLVPDWLGVVAHPLLIVTTLAVALAFAGRVRADPLRRALPLLALVLLLRCVLDPLDTGYYHVPFLMAVIAADAFAGSLVGTLGAAGGLFVVSELGTSITAVEVLYLVWSLPFAAYLAARTYGVDWHAWPARLRIRAADGHAARI
jgi:Glycosyltransferase family 87